MKTTSEAFDDSTDSTKPSPDHLALAQSVHTALVEGGVDKGLADALLCVAMGISCLYQSSKVDPEPPTLDAELTGQIAREMERSSTNLQAVLRTTCRDSSPSILRRKVEVILQEHVKFEVLALQVLIDRRLEDKAIKVSAKSA